MHYKYIIFNFFVKHSLKCLLYSLYKYYIVTSLELEVILKLLTCENIQYKYIVRVINKKQRNYYTIIVVVMRNLTYVILKY